MTLVLPAVGARKRGRFSLYEIAVFAMVALLLLVAVLGPFIAPASIYDSDMLNTLGPPDSTHWLGTDDQGRDIFWRIVAGARVSLLSSMLVVALYSLIGVLVATLATMGPRWLDEVLMRLTDIGLALPSMVVALGFAAALGPSLQSGIIALAITGWPMTARILRTTMAQTMTQPLCRGCSSAWCLQGAIDAQACTTELARHTDHQVGGRYLLYVADPRRPVLHWRRRATANP